MKQESDTPPQGARDEAQLIRRILDGETALFRRLADRYAGQVLRMVARLIPSQEEAEEAAQDTLLEAYRSLGRYDERQGSFPTWLMSIAYHVSLKHLRRQQRELPIIEPDALWMENIPDEETDILLDDTSESRVALLERAVGMLKPEDRMLLNLYYFDNHPIREISAIMEREESYLRSRLQWIRKKLAMIIKTLEDNEER